ncbi:MAG: hypothetical protein IT364_11705 [Candidatus Hydrogenedentes bacterium]|nr:hypothetical protein [Candidatus Hydrogenedentota bacterium]
MSRTFDAELTIMDTMTTLQSRLREVVKAAGLNPETAGAEIAARIGHSRQKVHQWLNGDTKSMDAGAAFAIQDRVLPISGGKFSARYILTGEGRLLMTRSEDIDLSDDAVQLAVDWQNLPFRMRAAVATLVEVIHRERYAVATKPKRQLAGKTTPVDDTNP